MPTKIFFIVNIVFGIITGDLVGRVHRPSKWKRAPRLRRNGALHSLFTINSQVVGINNSIANIVILSNNPTKMKFFSYICHCPSGHYILMKVFSLLSRTEIWTISRTREASTVHHLYGYLMRSASVIIRVWGIVYLRSGPSRASVQINEKCSTLSFYK